LYRKDIRLSINLASFGHFEHEEDHMIALFSVSVLTLFGLLLPIHTAIASPVVLSTIPGPQSTTAGVSDDILITFSENLDPQTIDSTSVRFFGHWSGEHRAVFSLEQGGSVLRCSPLTPFSAGELVGVTLTTAIANESGQPLETGFVLNFWTHTAPGTLTQTEIDRISVRRPGEPRVQAYGAYGGDFNGDGAGDLSVPNEQSNDVRLFLNDGAGRYSTFTVIPLPGGAVPSPNEGADFNNDGLLDLAIGNTGNDSVTVLLGDGTGGFTSTANYRASAAVRGIAIGDLDGDGDQDIVTANRTGNNVSVLLNHGSGTFANPLQLESSGSQETACALADANHDGVPDLFVGAFASNEMILLLGNGNGTFTLSSKLPAKGRPWMIAVGDVNGDGNVDVVSANSFDGTASVLFGDGTGQLDSARTYFSGEFVIAIDLGDLDGDGDLDMVTSNFSSADWRVFENAGDGTFPTSHRLLASVAGSCATLHDRDGDGDLDITGIDEVDDLVFLFENTGPVSVHDSDTPLSFSLEQNVPNPFNPATLIQFTIPVGTYGRTSLRVYDLLGREVAVLLDEDKAAGTYEATFNASGLASGMYLYRLFAGQQVMTRKMIVLR
jgi:hypothetical protein